VYFFFLLLNAKFKATTIPCPCTITWLCHVPITTAHTRSHKPTGCGCVLHSAFYSDE
jgi:hypothetical protein